MFLSYLCGAPSLSIGQPCCALASCCSTLVALDVDMDNGSHGRFPHVLCSQFSRMSELIKLHKEGLKSPQISLSGRLLILIYFNKLLLFTKYRGTYIFRTDFPRRRLLPVWLDLGSGFKSCLGGTVRQEMKTSGRDGSGYRPYKSDPGFSKWIISEVSSKVSAIFMRHIFTWTSLKHLETIWVFFRHILLSSS